MCYPILMKRYSYDVVFTHSPWDVWANKWKPDYFVDYISEPLAVGYLQVRKSRNDQHSLLCSMPQ